MKNLKELKNYEADNIVAKELGTDIHDRTQFRNEMYKLENEIIQKKTGITPTGKNLKAIIEGL